MVLFEELPVLYGWAGTLSILVLSVIEPVPLGTLKDAKLDVVSVRTGIFATELAE